MRRSVMFLQSAGLVSCLALAFGLSAPALAQNVTYQVPASQQASSGQVSSGNAGVERLETVAVALDHARVIRLPEKTATVIVGNPVIADVAVQKNGVLVVTGKSFGVTNLIALDANGAMLAESHISVRAASDSVMTVQRGLDRESYSCTPHCQPAIQLGDSGKFFGETGGQATQRNSLSAPSK